MTRKLSLAVAVLLLCAVGAFAQQPVTINQASTNATPVNVSCSSAGNCPVNASQVGAPWTMDLTKAGSVTLVTVATGGTVPVSGGVVDVTQPSGLTAGTWRGLSLTAAAGLRVATGADTFHVTVDAAPTTAVTGTFWQATQPVSCANGATCPTNATLQTSTGTDIGNVGLKAAQTLATVTSITNAVLTNADTTIGGTSAPTKSFTVNGKSNDGTPQYQPVPLGAGGRSVIVEGIAGGTAQPVSCAAGSNCPVNATLQTGSALAGEFVPVATATTTDTLTRCNIVSAASTNSNNCKNAAGNVYEIRVFNTTTTVYYLRTYNLTTAPTCSSATGFIESFPIPPAVASGGVGGFVAPIVNGEAYSTGIGYCLTGGSSSTDNTNAATGILGDILYK